MEYFHHTDAEVHAIHLDVTDRQAMAEAADEVERVLALFNFFVQYGWSKYFWPDARCHL